MSTHRHSDHARHLALSGAVLLLCLLALLAELWGGSFLSYLRGTADLQHAPLVMAALVVGAFVLGLEWNGILNLRRVKRQSLAAVERNHPYLPGSEQLMVTLCLTLACGLLASPVAVKTYAFSVEVVEQVILQDAADDVTDPAAGSGETAADAIATGSGTEMATGSGTTATGAVVSGSGASASGQTASGSGTIMTGSGSGATGVIAGGESTDAAGGAVPEHAAISSTSSQPSAEFGWSSSAAPEPGTLMLEAAQETVLAADAPRFTLVDVELPVATEMLLEAGTLKPEVAMAEIVRAAVNPETDLKAGIAAALVESAREEIAQVVTDDSVGTTILTAEDQGRITRQDVLEARVAEAIVEDGALTREVADRVADDAAASAAITALADDAGVQAAVVDSLVEAALNPGLTAESAMVAAIAELQPDLTDTALTAVTQAVAQDDGTIRAIAQAVAESGPASPLAPAQTEPVLKVRLIGRDGSVIAPRYHFVPGSVVLVLEPIARFTPGLYTLEVTVTNPLTGEAQVFTQDFAWGVLAMNADQDRYRAGETAVLHMGVLDDRGEMVCNADVVLTAEAPDGSMVSLSTENGGIVRSETCTVKDSELTAPDFSTVLPLTQSGTYRLTLAARTPNGERSTQTSIQVRGDWPYVIRRTAATRLFPIGESPMDIQVAFTEEFSGTITDTVPEGFRIVSTSPNALVTAAGSGSVIRWTGSWFAGTTVRFSYVYDAPDESPQFFLTGPLAMDSAEGMDEVELRAWQIANDAPGDLTGRLFSDEGTTPLANRDVSVSLNGAAKAGSGTTNSQGWFTISGIGALTGGTILTFYADNESEKAVTVTTGSGGTMTGIHLYQNHLILRSGTGGSATLTTTHLNVADNNGDTDITSLYSLSSNDLSFKGNAELYIWPSTQFVPAGRIRGYSLENRGTLTLGTNGLTLSGSLITGTGTLTTSTGVTLTATTPQTLTLGANAVQNLTLDDGLVGYWKFDEGVGGSGATIRDSSRSANMTTIYSTPIWSGSTMYTSNFYNPKSLKFDGSDDMVKAGTSTLNFEGTNKFSICMWYKTPASPASNMFLAGKEESAGNFRGYGILILNSAGFPYRVNIINTSGVAGITVNFPRTNDANWHHICMRYNGSGVIGGVEMFEDGVYLTASGLSDNLAGATIVNTNNFQIGARNNTTGFIGNIDDVRVYNRVLLTSEVRSLAAGNPATGSGKVLLASSLDINNNLVLNGSTLDVSNSNYSVTVGGNIQNAGDFVKRSGTVTLDGSGTQTLSGSTVFHNLSRIVSSARTLFFDYTSRQAASGALTLRGASANLLSLRSTRAGSGARLLLDGDSGTQTLDYLDVKDSIATGGVELRCYTGCVNSGNTFNWSFGSITGRLFSDEGTTPLANRDVSVSINGAARAGSGVTNSQGWFTISSITTLTGGSVVTLYVDNESEKAVVVSTGSGGTMTGIHLYQNHLILRSGTGGSATLTTTHLNVADNNGDTDITSLYSLSSNDLSFKGNAELYIWPSTQFVPAGRIRGYSLENRGTLTLGTNGLTLSGSLITGTGTLTTSTGVTLTATTPQTLTLGANAVQNLTLDDGLVGYWKFDEGVGSSGSTIRDSSRFGHATTLYSNPVWSGSSLWSSRFYNQKALKLDGTDDYVIGSTGSFLSMLNAKFTLATWVKNGSATMSRSEWIAGRYRSSTNKRGWLCGVGFDSRVYCYLTTDGTTGTLMTIMSHNPISNWNQWKHVSVSVNGSSSVVFIDGVAVTTDVTNPISAVYATPEPMRIGAQGDVSGASWTGYIDDVRVYSRVLSASEAGRLASGYPNAGSGTLTLGSNLDVDGNLTLNGSTLDVSSSNYAITLAGNIQNAGDFVKRSGTVTLDGSGTQTLSGSTVFHNLSRIVSSARTLFFDYTSRQAASGALTLRGASSNLLSLRSTRAGSGARLLLDGDSGTQTIDYLDVKDSNASGGATLLCSISTEGCTDSGNNTNWNELFSISGRVFANTGATAGLASKTVAVSLNGAAAAATTDTDGNGYFSLSGINASSLTGGTVVALYLDGETEKAVTVSHGSGGSMTGMTLIRDTLVIQSGTGGSNLGQPVTSAHLLVADNNGDSDISSLYTTSSSNVTVVSGKRLSVQQRGVLSLGGTLTTSYLHMGAASGALIQGSNTITLNAHYTQSGGTFWGGSGLVSIPTNGRFTQDGGLFRSTSYQLSVGGAFTHTEGGVFHHGSGTVKMAGGNGYTADVNVSETFYNLILENGGTRIIMGTGDTWVVLSTLTWNGGGLDTGTVDARGAIQVEPPATGYHTTPSTLMINGSAGQSCVLEAAADLSRVVMLNPLATCTGSGAGTVLFESSVEIADGTFALGSTAADINGGLTLSGGTLTAPSTTMNVAGAWTHTAGGTFNHNGGTVIFDGSSSTVNVAATETFNNLTVQKTHNNTLTVSAGDTLNVLGTLVVDNGLVATGTLQPKGNVRVLSAADGGSAAMTFAGTGGQLYTSTGGTVVTGTWKVAKPSGTLTLSGVLSLNTSGQDFFLTGGTLDINGVHLTVNDRFEVGTGTVLRLTGDETLTGGPDKIFQNSTIWYDAAGSTRRLKAFAVNQQHMVLGSTGSAVFQLPALGLSMSGSLTISGGTLSFDGGQTLTLSGSWTRTGGAFSSGTGTVIFAKSSAKTLTESSAFYNLTATGGAVTLGGNLDVNNHLLIGAGGTLDVSGSSYSINLAGNFWNQGGTFTKRSGTVTLDGSGTQTLSGSTVFHNLSRVVSAARTLFLAHNGVQAVSGALTLRGLQGNLLSLRSTRTGSGARLLLDGDSGTQTLDYLDVKDSIATGGAALVCYTNTEGCTDSGNTTNWTFTAASPTGTGTLIGLAWVDTDGDGVRDAGETTGLSGLSISLTGTTATGASITRSTTSGSGGSGALVVPISNSAGYTLTLNGGTTPTGYIRTRFNSSGGNVLGTGGTITVRYGYVLPSTATGSVYIDVNDNGRRDAGETSILSGVTVTLLGTTATGASVNQSAVTSSTGSYAFTWLPPASGQYTVGIVSATVPSGYRATAFTNSGITVSQGGTRITTNFGYTWYGTMSGAVFLDSDRDGVRDPGETAAYSGATVTLTGTTASGGALNLTATTTSTGAFAFHSVPYGTSAYTLTLTVPSGFQATTSSALSRTVSLGQHAPSALFGLFRLTGYGTVHGIVWEDEDGDGVQDGGETTGLSGQTVAVSGTTATGAALSLSRLTSATGSAAFAVPVSTAAGYTVTVNGGVAPTGYLRTRFNSSGSNVVGTGGTVTVRFGYVRASTLTGAVFLDLDEDGVRDGNESGVLSGVTLRLRGTSATGGTLDVTRQSNASGRYLYNLLPVSSGSFILTVTAPDGYEGTAGLSRSIAFATGGQLKVRDIGLVYRSAQEEGGDEAVSASATVSGGSRRSPPVVIRLVPTVPAGSDRPAPSLPPPGSPLEPETTQPTSPRTPQLPPDITLDLERRIREDRLMGSAPVQGFQLPEEESRDERVRVTEDRILNGILHGTRAVTEPVSWIRSAAGRTAATIRSAADGAASLAMRGVSAVQSVGGGVLAWAGRSITAPLARAVLTAGRAGEDMVVAVRQVATGLRVPDLRLRYSGNAAVAWLGRTVVNPARLALNGALDAAARTAGSVRQADRAVRTQAARALYGTVARSARVGLRVTDRVARPAAALIQQVPDRTGSALVSAWRTGRDAADAAARGTVRAGGRLARGTAHAIAVAAVTLQDDLRSMVDGGRAAITRVARGLSPDNAGTAEHAAAPVTERLYTTSLTREGDRVVLSALHLSVLNSLTGRPYRRTPVVLFSDPKIAVTDDEGVATFHQVEAGRHRLEIHAEGEEVESRDIIIEPPSGLTLEEQKQIEVVMPVVKVLVEGEKPAAWHMPVIGWIGIGLLVLGNAGLMAYVWRRSGRGGTPGPRLVYPA